MYNRQKLLLGVMQTLVEHGLNNRSYLVKSIFLLRQKFGASIIGYDFFPYKYGPFSSMLYDDLLALERYGLLDKTALSLTEKGQGIAKAMPGGSSVFSGLADIILSYPNRKSIVRFVYGRYPEFTIRSSNPQNVPNKCSAGIFSVGYEGRTIDGFLNELIQNGVSLVVDVRKNAFSMKRGFSKKPLERRLKMAGIEYAHFPELGIAPAKRKNLSAPGARAKLLENYKNELPLKKDKITEVDMLGKKQRIALMCFEADKCLCHRGVLSDFLSQEVVHIEGKNSCSG